MFQNSEAIKNELTRVIKEALEAHLEEHGTLKNLDWFNASAETTDFYDALTKEHAA
ncbi:hypothetical protein [Sulfuricurvum sp. IAE1]|uniref:hypothetical protein n=1 Tax=Sulfuricurvum sp. IAE1 TaxID=2546102 RepID=UPI001404C0C4|nr:hypothetical protein [Sulfuricurvum sp. IAE1]